MVWMQKLIESLRLWFDHLKKIFINQITIKETPL